MSIEIVNIISMSDIDDYTVAKNKAQLWVLKLIPVMFREMRYPPEGCKE